MSRIRHDNGDDVIDTHGSHIRAHHAHTRNVTSWVHKDHHTPLHRGVHEVPEDTNDTPPL